MRNGVWRTMCMVYVKAFQSGWKAVLTYIFLLAAVLNFFRMYGQEVLSVSFFFILQTKEARLEWGSYLLCIELPLRPALSRRRRRPGT